MPLSHFFSSSALVTFVFLGSFAWAQKDDCPSIEGKIGIIIGGKGATNDTMKKCYPDSGDLLAVGEPEGKKLINCFVNRINERAKSAEKFIVVGHSSGSAHAENVVKGVRDKSKVRLVLLEGIGNPKIQESVETSCWYAQDGAKMGFNGPVMRDKKNCLRGAKAIDTPQCHGNVLCLHISLVNNKAPADLTRANVFVRGLENCEGNRKWLGLESSAGSVMPKAEPETAR
jgi:hypothetical protein